MMAKRIITVLLLLCLVFTIIGCQTVQGIGGDIQWVGEKSAEALE